MTSFPFEKENKNNEMDATMQKGVATNLQRLCSENFRKTYYICS